MERVVRRLASPLPGREREFAVYWLATFLIDGAWGLTMPLLPVYLFETGMSLPAIGLVQALAGLAAFLSQGWIGTLSDRRASRHRYLILAVAATAPVTVALAHLRSPVLLALAVTANGLLMTTYVSMLYTSVSALGRPGTAGRTFSTYRISGSIGWSLTTLSLGWLLAWGGIRGSYLIAAGVYALVTLLLVLGLRRAAAPRPREAAVPAAGGGGTGGGPRTGRDRPPLEEMPDPRRILSHPELRLFYLAGGLFTFAQMSGIVYLPIYLRETLGVSDVLFGVLQAIPAMFEVPFMLGFGRSGDRWGTAVPLAVGYLGGVVRWAILPFLAAPAHLAAVQALQAFSFSAGEILTVSHLSERIGLAARGTAVGILASFQALGRVAAPFTAGLIGQAAGLRAVFFSASAALLAATILMQGSNLVERRTQRHVPCNPAPATAGGCAGKHGEGGE
ncbi:MFS transporter [Limnochorda pilosa]|uniref:Major facilitator superfamily (MFS) profile domain-containing protein n=1 Tax=Limnochorda pilosa TaxID=1555112 RepID=A0A0K2SMC6_LIMPI|nr:MFS transporter [Limnochorda pilosa]BAS28271.1 hypothetical protein LIP_2430 [Limnochorda pilosa]